MRTKIRIERGTSGSLRADFMLLANRGGEYHGLAFGIAIAMGAFTSGGLVVPYSGIQVGIEHVYNQIGQDEYGGHE